MPPRACARGRAGGTVRVQEARRDPDPPLAFELPSQGGLSGTWTDDTALARNLWRSLAERGDLDTADVLARHLVWFATDLPDVGNLTRRVLSGSGRDPDAASALRGGAGTEVSATNGSVMYCAPLGASERRVPTCSSTKPRRSPRPRTGTNAAGPRVSLRRFHGRCARPRRGSRYGGRTRGRRRRRSRGRRGARSPRRRGRSVPPDRRTRPGVHVLHRGGRVAGRGRRFGFEEGARHVVSLGGGYGHERSRGGRPWAPATAGASSPMRGSRGSPNGMRSKRRPRRSRSRRPPRGVAATLRPDPPTVRLLGVEPSEEIQYVVTRFFEASGTATTRRSATGSRASRGSRASGRMQGSGWRTGDSGPSLARPGA